MAQNHTSLRPLPHTPSRQSLQEHPVSPQHSTSTIHQEVVLGLQTRCSQCQEVPLECNRPMRQDARDPSLSTSERHLAGTQWLRPRTKSSKMMTRTSQCRHIKPSPFQQILVNPPYKPHPLTSIIMEQHHLRAPQTSNQLSKASIWLTYRPTTSTKQDSNSTVSKGVTTRLG